MKIFSKEASNFINPKDMVAAAKVLKNEDNTSFFQHLEGDLKWSWLKEEAGL